jgi:diguanylate cyclase (GGDEF)-like protein
METIRQTVLIVDDTPANIEVLCETLDGEYEILFATNGPDALEIAVDTSPDLILLDVVMPEMDGYQVCARLKEDPRTRGIPVIFVTAMDQEEDEAKGLNVGAIDYVTKPIRPPIVKARVRNHLELKRARDFLENLSSRDGLTGIYNRRRLDEVLEAEWRRARRSQSCLSLLLLDIDHFKAFNDHYGHLAGDDCLRQLAHAMVTGVQRSCDLVARYGGEEFACLLPDTDLHGAVQVANRISDRIASLNVPHAFSGVADHITVSVGVGTETPLVGQSFFDLIRRADEQLYIAKGLGRNQIRSALDDK